MSSSNGSDPWQPGAIHHGGHGHNGNRSGLDVDIRYFDSNGNDVVNIVTTSTVNGATVTNTNFAYQQADVDLVDNFLEKADNNGFRRNYTYGGSFNSNYSISQGAHKDHFHIGYGD